MRRCRRCVMPDTRPDTPFIDGVCSACIAYERRPQIDWDARKKALFDLLERHHGRCIVPSSGGKDSHYQALTLLDLGAKVTIVTATTCHLTDLGRKNIDNLARYADTIEVSPNKVQRAKLNRLGLVMVGDISWPEHVGIFTIPWKMACKLDIPLLFYGENPQDQYGGPLDTWDAVRMTSRWVSEFGGFLGLRASDMEMMVVPADMSMYKPPGEWQVTTCGLNGPLGTRTTDMEAHFLGQYLPWDSHQNAERAIAAGMQYARPFGSNWWPWENLDNAQTGIHDYFGFRKYGYTRAAAQLSVDIRSGRTRRDTAMAWLKAHDGDFPDIYAGVVHYDILDRIGMTPAHFEDVLAQFTNWDLFERKEPRPKLKAESWD